MIFASPHPDPARLAALLPHRPIAADPFRPTPPAFYGAAVQQALSTFRSPMMPPDIRFALVREPRRANAKPVAMATLPALARAIHASRGQRAIQLQDAPLNVQGWGELQGVSIFTLSEAGEPQTYIGWAWLDGRPRQSLEAALAATKANVPAIGRAA